MKNIVFTLLSLLFLSPLLDLPLFALLNAAVADDDADNLSDAPTVASEADEEASDSDSASEGGDEPSATLVCQGRHERESSTERKTVVIFARILQ